VAQDEVKENNMKDILRHV